MNLTVDVFIQCGCTAVFFLYVLLQNSVTPKHRAGKQQRPKPGKFTFFTESGSPYDKDEVVEIIQKGKPTETVAQRSYE